ncbi:MAG: STAS domain-containing protein [Planctomycetota bacterium]|nr:STAS domain-containing protein [Planctomycetota bacterium]MDI6787648.1 STAS domain-containing protein [Planctomycetota bacterium]
MPELQITTKKLDEHIYLIALKGVLDNQTAGILSETFYNFFSQNIWNFVVDLSELTYLGSAGVGLFISLLDTLEEHKGNIVFIHPQENVNEVFKLFKLATFFSITANLEEGVRELKNLSH